MTTEPVLVLQMQRMGDIILSFPLFLWTKRTSPDHPVWVVAEPGFYNELLGVLPPGHVPALDGRQRTGGQKLQVHPELEPQAGSGRTGRQFEGRPQVRGRAHGVRPARPWTLAALSGGAYRKQPPQPFPWAELNALDCVDPGCFSSTNFDPPREIDPENHAVGLFLGASDENKRPDAWFWASLARELEKRGLKVVLLGGPGDKALCEEVKKLFTGRVVDACGQFGLREFAAVGQTLSLMVTPDTGPMHLAAWSGLLTLNLSMGPVNPWETGPYPPGHYVLRANMSCLDCWHCRFEKSRCQDHFDPAQVAYLIWRLVTPRGANRAFVPPGTRLYRTGRTPEGFYDLVPVGQSGKRASDYLGEFWRSLFGASLACGTGKGLNSPGRPWPKPTPTWPRGFREPRRSLRHESGSPWCPEPPLGRASGPRRLPCSDPWPATCTWTWKMPISRARPWRDAWIGWNSCVRFCPDLLGRRTRPHRLNTVPARGPAPDLADGENTSPVPYF